MKKQSEVTNVVTPNFGGGRKDVAGKVGPFELRCLIEALIDGKYGINAHTTEGGTIFLDWEGQQWAVDCCYPDMLHEQDALWMIHFRANGDEKEFIRRYREWKAYVREHRTDFGEEFPDRFRPTGESLLKAHQREEGSV